MTPDYMYDYDMDKNGESGLAPDDFEKYEDKKILIKISVLLISDLTALNQCLTARPISSSS